MSKSISIVPSVIMLGNSITLPVIDGKIELSSWQQIVLIDFDNKVSSKQIVVSVVE